MFKTDENNVNADKPLIEKLAASFPLLCGLGALLLYESSNAGGLFWGDGGEFLAVSKTLGIGHAYGHPLFWIAGRISILLNPANPAAAMNHLTALFSAATCFLVALLVKNWCNERLSPSQRLIVIFTVTGSYATASTVWTQATFIEVYNFQAFFLVLAIYFLDRYAFRNDGVRNLFIASYIWGLSITLGMYVLLLAILPASIWVIRKNSRRIYPAHILLSVVFLILGLSTWLYLPIRSAANPTFLWEKLDSLSAFFSYLTRKNWANIQVAGVITVPFTFTKTLKILSENLGFWGLLLSLVCLWDLLKHDEHRPVFPYYFSTLFLFLAFSCLVPLTMTLRQMVEMDVYFIPIFLLAIPVLTVGANKLIVILKGPLRPLILLPVIIMTWTRWDSIDISDNPITEKFNHYLTSNIPPSSLVLPASNMVEHLLYYHVFALGNPNNYTLFNANLNESLKSQISPFLERKGVLFETNHQFLSAIETFDKIQIAGPFFMLNKDSIVAKNLESNFLHDFSFEDIKPDQLHTLDRINFATIWARRAKYWQFYISKIGNRESSNINQAYRRCLFALDRALRLDNFSIVGSVCASNLSHILLQAGRLEDAENFAHQALGINPFSAEAYRSLYITSMRQNQSDQALEYLKRLTRLEPQNGENHLNMAALYVRFNQTTRAKKAYQRGISLGAEPRKDLEDSLF